jgi:hypothetical protein
MASHTSSRLRSPSAFGGVFVILAGCSDGVNTERGDNAELIASHDASLSAFSAQSPPSDDVLCSLVMGASTYDDALALLGETDTQLPGSVLSYAYGPIDTDGHHQVLTLAFDPQELLEDADAISMQLPRCWLRGEAETAKNRLQLPALVQTAPSPHQDPAQYPVLPSEAQLCRVVIGETTHDDIYFDIFESPIAQLALSSSQLGLEYRFRDPLTSRIVSLYFFSATDDPVGSPPVVTKIVAYNVPRLPSCWVNLFTGDIPRAEPSPSRSQSASGIFRAPE